MRLSPPCRIGQPPAAEVRHVVRVVYLGVEQLHHDGDAVLFRDGDNLVQPFGAVGETLNIAHAVPVSGKANDLFVSSGADLWAHFFNPGNQGIVVFLAV